MACQGLDLRVERTKRRCCNQRRGDLPALAHATERGRTGAGEKHWPQQPCCRTPRRVRRRDAEHEGEPREQDGRLLREGEGRALHRARRVLGRYSWRLEVRRTKLSMCMVWGNMSTK